MPNDIREIEREKRNEVEDEYFEKKENLDKKEKELIKQEKELNEKNCYGKRVQRVQWKKIAMENEYNLKFAFLKKWEEDLTKRERDSGKKQRKWASIWRIYEVNQIYFLEKIIL